MIRTDWFFLLGINFCIFQEVPDKSLITLSFLLSTCKENTYKQYHGGRDPAKTNDGFAHASF